MNNEKKQGLRSTSLMSVLFVIVFMIFTFSRLINQETNSSPEQALKRAEGLAYQIAEVRKGSSRGPASVAALNHLVQNEGDIGLDPWGKAYRFKVIGGGENEPMRILVWSAGPNLKLDTGEKSLDSKAFDKNLLPLSGDDLGVLISFK